MNALIPSLVCLLIAGTTSAELINHWTLDEGSGTAVTDSINGNNGVFSPLDATGPQWATTNLPSVPSGTSAAVDFDGTADHIAITGYTGISGTGSRTISAWIRTRNTGTNQNMSIVSWGQNTSGAKNTFRVQSNNGAPGTLRFEVNGGYAVGSTVLTDGLWHHVAMTWENDGSPNVTDTLLYVDGILETLSISQTQTISTGSSADVRIGTDFAGRPWNGWIDDVRIYDEALAAEDIFAIATGVPEPSTAILLLSGLAFLASRRVMRR